MAAFKWNARYLLLSIAESVQLLVLLYYQHHATTSVTLGYIRPKAQGKLLFLLFCFIDNLSTFWLGSIVCENCRRACRLTLSQRTNERTNLTGMELNGVPINIFRKEIVYAHYVPSRGENESNLKKVMSWISLYYLWGYDDVLKIPNKFMSHFKCNSFVIPEYTNVYIKWQADVYYIQRQGI